MIKKIKIVYKVVQYTAERKWKSCCMNNYFPEQYRIEYRLDTEIQPILEGSKIFCFSSLSLAIDFINDYSFTYSYIHNQLYKMCVLECETSDYYIPKQCQLPNFNQIEKFWKCKRSRHKYHGPCSMTIPQGTILCQSILPRRCVYIRDGVPS